MGSFKVQINEVCDDTEHRSCLYKYFFKNELVEKNQWNLFCGFLFISFADAVICLVTVKRSSIDFSIF